MTPLQTILGVEMPSDPFQAMQALREDGWCVVIKCMPVEAGWVIERSRSEYDAPCEDRQVGHGKWLCEASDMGYLQKGKRNHRFRNDCFGMGDTPAEAIKKVWDAIARDAARRDKK